MSAFADASYLNDLLGIEDFTADKDYGRDRGMNPTPSDAQKKAFDRMAKCVATKSSSKLKDEAGEDCLAFDLKSKKRVILFEAKVLKKSYSAMVQHTCTRHLVLLNDIILVCSGNSSSGMSSSSMSFSMSSGNKLNIHQVFYLDKITLCDLQKVSPSEDTAAFEIGTNDRPYHFIAESESDKKIWLEEIELAILAIRKEEEAQKGLGWYHQTIQGSLYSAAINGPIDVLHLHIEEFKSKGTSLDTLDQSGMTALHWAALFDRLDAVICLVENGCNIDTLNQGLNSAVLLAAARGNGNVIIYLIEQGADIFIRNLKDTDCLFMSIYGNRPGFNLESVITILKSKRMNMNNQDSSGATPLHQCAVQNIAGPIRILADCGANINATHGRNGLTPLQLACSTSNPDAETVRAILDKGAHPNIRDTARRTAFDLVLVAHNAKKATMNDGALIAEFAQVSLPVLMELCKKGARFDKDGIAALRPSFQDAISTSVTYWGEQIQPKDNQFNIFMRNERQSRKPPSWTDDAASKLCLLCMDKFTLTNRKHHCRWCGILCCDTCSTKRLKIDGSVASPGSNKGGEAQGDRVCDGCFNNLVYAFLFWANQMARATKDEREQKEVMITKEVADMSLSNSRSPTSASNKSSSMDKTTGAANEAMEQLQARGQKIQQTAQESEELRDAASEFHTMTKKLLKQQQNKSMW